MLWFVFSERFALKKSGGIIAWGGRYGIFTKVIVSTDVVSSVRSNQRRGGLVCAHVLGCTIEHPSKVSAI